MVHRSVLFRGLSLLAVVLVVACSPAAPAAPQKPAAAPTTAEAAKPTAPAAPAAPAAQASPAAAPAAPAAAASPAAAAPAASPAAASQPAGAPAQVASVAPAAVKAKIPQEILDGATKEGELLLLWTSTSTEEWRQRFQDAFNTYYGVNVKIVHTQSNNWGRDTSKLITETGAGQKPSVDLALIGDSSYSDLSQAGLLGQYKWSEMFGVPARAVMFNGGAYSFAHQIVAPAYNRDLVKGADIPKSWDDFLDPKWKGKIGVPSATHVWARLSQAWGDEKTTDFVTKLAAQNPRLGAFGDLNQSMQLGEISLMTAMIDNLQNVNLKKNAPIAWADQVSPVLAQALMAGPIKGAAHPNAALLFAGFLASDKGQALWLEFQEQGSIYTEGSPSWKLVQGKNPIVLEEAFMAKDLAPRTTKYGNILGYR